MPTDYLIIFSTFPKRKDAERVAERLLEKRLAACCNLIPGLTSFFRWKGKKERCQEVLLLIKTEKRLFGKLRAFLRTHHPYDLPECIGVAITKGDHSYLKWIGEETR